MDSTSLIQGLSTELLAAELRRRQDDASPAPDSKPACSSGERGTYDTPLHVLALFVILAISTLACAFPLLTRKVSKGRKQSNIVFICQHLGTGVLIATAFVHLLPTAFSSLTDPCLPFFFNEGYPPMAGLVAMASALLVVWIESSLATRGVKHSHGLDDEDDDDDVTQNHHHGSVSTGGDSPVVRRRRISEVETALEPAETRALVDDISPLPGSGFPVSAFRPEASSRRDRDGSLSLGSSDDDDDDDDDGNSTTKKKTAHNKNDDDDDDDMAIGLDELQPTPNPNTYSDSANARRLAVPPVKAVKPPSTPTATPTITGTTPEEQKRMLLQCLLLEAGILFHSIFIGMALSVATGPTFIVFLVAISFHQGFEGLALGSRIAALQFPRKSLRPWLMVCAYGTTTPIGQAIGLVVHNMYDPRSQTGLLMVGFMNAISSGLLLFAGLVQLLAEDFLSDKSYRVLTGKRRRDAFISVVAGATLMAIVGAFA